MPQFQCPSSKNRKEKIKIHNFLAFLVFSFREETFFSARPDPGQRRENIILALHGTENVKHVNILNLRVNYISHEKYKHNMNDVNFLYVQIDVS